jgi:hypothetical protein
VAAAATCAPGRRAPFCLLGRPSSSQPPRSASLSRSIHTLNAGVPDCRPHARLNGKATTFLYESPRTAQRRHHVVPIWQEEQAAAAAAAKLRPPAGHQGHFVVAWTARPHDTRDQRPKWSSRPPGTREGSRRSPEPDTDPRCKREQLVQLAAGP